VRIHLEGLYDQLTAVRILGPLYDDTGICGQVIEEDPTAVGSMYQILNRLFRSWPKFSGDAHYPVPSGIERVSAQSAYYQYAKWTGNYGKMRRKLLDHCINELEKELT